MRECKATGLYKLAACSLWLAASIVLGPAVSRAEELTILYTGATHAMLYPCNCPREPDGGILRRVSLVDKLRRQNRHTLLLDAGLFFAGGAEDNYSQNAQLDMQRSLVNIRAMELIRYDAVSLGTEEFNFGRDFLLQAAGSVKLNFLSLNAVFPLAHVQIKPYIIKEMAGLKIGIAGLTNPAAAAKVAGYITFSEPAASLRQVVSELKAKAVELVILLSNLSESENAKLANDVPGIDIIVSASRGQEEHSGKIANTIIARASSQGRRLGRLVLTLTDKKISAYRSEELRLSPDIEDSAQAKTLLPRCFSDENCQKDGLVGFCREAGTLQARCLFPESAEARLFIITAKPCRICNPQPFADQLKKLFPRLSQEYLYYPQDSRALDLIKKLEITGLPAYVFERRIEEDGNFSRLKDNFQLKDGYYLAKPFYSGFSYLVNRQLIAGRRDVFLSLFDEHSPALLEGIKEFKPTLHFLAVKQKEGFETPNGLVELEEDLRALCVQRYYPEFFWDYLSCRAANIHSSWWESCLHEVDFSRLKACALSTEGRQLLEENIKLNQELAVMLGQVFLLDNQEIFSLQGRPEKESLGKILKTTSEANNGQKK